MALYGTVFLFSLSSQRPRLREGRPAADGGGAGRRTGRAGPAVGVLDPARQVGGGPGIAGFGAPVPGVVAGKRASPAGSAALFAVASVLSSRPGRGPAGS
ncbi:hypothetical protein [Streptomyces sp. AGS-58]|uniref:hypothetical protein n=1 Tax=unclassified Streptomyces TaxID=2593676 RepID=UPI0035A27797